MSLVYDKLVLYVHKCEKCRGIIISTSPYQCALNASRHYTRHNIEKNIDEIDVKRIEIDVQ